MNLTTIIGLELKRLLSSPAVMAGLVLILLVGIYAIDQGSRTIDQQRRVLSESQRIENEHWERMIQLHANPDPLNTLYYLNFFTRHEPSRYATLSLGLRDVNPYNLKIRILSLEGQLYDSELTNAATRATGNFDLAFLLVFLYPLLLIALLHNTISEDRENGTWPIVRFQAQRIEWLSAIRLLLRFGLVLAVWWLTLLIAIIRLDLPIDRRLLMIGLGSTLYLLFWFGLSAALATSRHSSNRIALQLFSIWLALTIVIPGSINLALNRLLPAGEAFEVVIRQREGYHQQWDVPKSETMARFFTSYPEYASFVAPADRFSWGWYYAAQHIGDLEAASAVRELRRKLIRRADWIERTGWLIPSVNLQILFNRVARTDLESHLGYLDSVRSYHEQLRRRLYPALMSSEPARIDWPALPRHSYSEEEVSPPVTSLLLPLLGLISITLALARRRLARIAGIFQSDE